MDTEAMYPALTGEPVTEYHAKLCEINGHATHITDGVRDIFCPRCGAHAWKFCASCFGPHSVDAPDVCEYCEPTEVDTSGPKAITPPPPPEPTIVPVEYASDNDQRYGIAFRSASDHRIKGAKHNRGASFTITVWVNIFRPNPHPIAVWKGVGMIGGPGKYLGADNKGTDEPYSVTTSAQAAVISNRPGLGGQLGEEISIGQAVVLVLPDGTELGPFIVTDRRMADPYLVEA